MSGKLCIVATPIGNLRDISPRAVDALRSSALILCEDTRHTLKLLREYGIDVPAESFHEHNEDAKAERMVQRIREGETISLVSDAGTPLVSDPGYPLVRRLREEGLRVEPIPGPCAAVLALSASGLPPMPFAFYGFAPHREGERREFYRDLASKAMTAVIYESPFRIVDSLEAAREILGDVEATVAREMTKLHEELIHGSLSEIIAALRARDSIKGEITVVFGAAKHGEIAEPDSDTLREEFEQLRAQGLRRNDATKALAEKYRMKKNELYRLLIGEDE
jgi:16S rRNA (cytidine1402-2'-O)-methyltransferase